MPWPINVIDHQQTQCCLNRETSFTKCNIYHHHLVWKHVTGNKKTNGCNAVYLSRNMIHVALYSHSYQPAMHTHESIVQYIPRNMHTVFALLCFVVVIHWLIFPYPSGLLHWHCGNLTIAPVPAKQPWWIWINTSCEFIMNNCITTTKQSTTKPCAYFLGYTVQVMLLVSYI